MSSKVDFFLRISKISLGILANSMLSIRRLGANVMAKGTLFTRIRQINTNLKSSFVEFETSQDLKTAVEKLDGQSFKNATVHCTSDVSEKATAKRIDN